MSRETGEESRDKRRCDYKKFSSNTENDTQFKIIAPRFTLEKDVILPVTSRVHIEEALAKIRFHKTIYIDWGFEEVDPLGKGIVLNFYGQPGTGKTLAAEALAGSLGLPFVSLGIAEIESKFMGETSKNIQSVFELGREHGAVLFFDEADTLLGKRLSSVTQGVDNEVNSMRSTMLIELERFEGIAIFATNFFENYDKAFESRITHHVYFDLPDIESRKAIWNKMIVPKIPLGMERGALLDEVAKITEGFSGRDIRTCMRLSLPKVVLSNNKDMVFGGLSIDHLSESIKQINKAKREIGIRSYEKKLGESESKLTHKLLGLNYEGGQE